MCEYCEKEKRLLNDNYYEMYITKDTTLGYSLLFKINDEWCNIGYLNYCPKCGRNLNKEIIEENYGL